MKHVSWRHCMVFVALVLLVVMTSFISYLLGTFYSGVDSGITVHNNGDKSALSVAFCVLAKNERDLYEWVDYHRQLNVSKFYVLDEYSNPPLNQQIPNLISSGLVEYQRYSFFWMKALHYLGFPTKNHLRTAFDDCLRMHGHKHDWMGFLDADEFVILKDENEQSLPEFLTKYEDYGGIVLNWMLFGSSGHITRPAGGILKNYYRCVPNGTVKTIVQTRHTIGTGGNCHYFTYKEPFYAVNGNFNRIDGHWSYPESLDHIYINHYKMKSLEDFNAKLARWGKTSSSRAYKANLSPELFNEMDNMMTSNCSIPKIVTSQEYRILQEDITCTFQENINHVRARAAETCTFKDRITPY